VTTHAAGGIPVVVMGVSGSGKSSVGTRLAQAMACPFVEGDDLHPAANIAKMSSGVPLDDDDRWPWLERIGKRLQLAGETGIVISCSALRFAYRERLRQMAGQRLRFVFLDAPRPLLEERLRLRQSHFMPLSLLDSQFAALELPLGEADVAIVPVDQPPDDIVRDALAALRAGQV
jgi:gluconokinase